MFMLLLGAFSAFFGKHRTQKKLNINRPIDRHRKSLNSSKNTNSSIILETINKSVCSVMLFYSRDANFTEMET